MAVLPRFALRKFTSQFIDPALARPARAVNTDLICPGGATTLQANNYYMKPQQKKKTAVSFYFIIVFRNHKYDYHFASQNSKKTSQSLCCTRHEFVLIIIAFFPAFLQSIRFHLYLSLQGWKWIAGVTGVGLLGGGLMLGGNWTGLDDEFGIEPFPKQQYHRARNKMSDW